MTTNIGTSGWDSRVAIGGTCGTQSRLLIDISKKLGTYVVFAVVSMVLIEICSFVQGKQNEVPGQWLQYIITGKGGSYF